tara:strand:+ start:6806 stop:7174 length:369 start_codon:yes stop_codon:yes gene_type:complete
MNEFQSMLREAFLGEEPFDPKPGHVDLEAAIQRFDKRERVLRCLMWLGVTLMTGVCVWSAWRFLRADEAASTKSLILYATVFLFGAQAVGTSKFFLFTSQQSFSLQKALLRAQLTWRNGSQG